MATVGISPGRVGEQAVFSKRDLDRDVGLLLILVVATFVVAVSTFVEVNIDREAIRGSLKEIVDEEVRYLTSWSFNLGGGLLLIVAGVGLFLVLRSCDEALAIIGMVGLIASGVAVIVATMSYFVLFFLANDSVGLGPTEGAALVSTARAVGLAATTIYLTGLSLVGFGVLPLGVLIARSGVIPWWLGSWAIGSGVLMLFAWVILAHEGVGFVIVAAGSIGVLLFFLMLGLWLLIEGSPTPSTEQRSIADGMEGSCGEAARGRRPPSVA